MRRMLTRNPDENHCCNLLLGYIRFTQIIAKTRECELSSNSNSSLEYEQLTLNHVRTKFFDEAFVKSIKFYLQML